MRPPSAHSCVAAAAGRAGVAASPHLEGAPWHAYTGNAATGEHSWQEGRVRSVRWEEEAGEQT